MRLAWGSKVFAEVIDQWRTLLDAVRVTDHTQLEEWAHAASVADGPGAAWICFEDDEGPLAVLHCTIERRKLGPLTTRVLRNGPADGLLAARCDPAALRAALLKAWSQEGEPVDVLSLAGLREGWAFHELARVTPSRLREEQRFGGYSAIDTRVPADEWFAAAGKNLRGSLRKAGNRANRQGEVRTVPAQSADDVRTAFEDYCRLEATGWKSSAGALINRPDEHRYLEAGLLEAAKTDRARVRSLWIGDTLAASQLGVLAGTSMVLLKVTYNEDLAPMAPSNLLLADLVRECCDDPAVERIDLVTSQPWHARWHPVTHPTFQMQAFNIRRPAGLLAQTATFLRRKRQRV